MVQNLFKQTFTTNTTTTSTFDFDIVITTLDGFSWQNTGVSIKYKILASSLASTLGYYEGVATWILASASLSAGTSGNLIRLGSLSSLAPTYTAYNSTTARCEIISPFSISTNWFISVEGQMYDSGI